MLFIHQQSRIFLCSRFPYILDPSLLCYRNSGILKLAFSKIPCSESVWPPLSPLHWPKEKRQKTFLRSCHRNRYYLGKNLMDIKLE